MTDIKDSTAGYPVILNGDHAEFEMEHANTPAKERPDWPMPSFDARDWAEAFDKLFIVSCIDGYATKPVDDAVGLMIAWFAGALMRGFDEHSARPEVVRCCNGYEKLAAALARLANEVMGCEAFEPQLRREMGNTNYSLLIQRAKEARAVLSEVEDGK